MASQGWVSFLCRYVWIAFYAVCVACSPPTSSLHKIGEDPPRVDLGGGWSAIVKSVETPHECEQFWSSLTKLVGFERDRDPMVEITVTHAEHEDASYFVMYDDDLEESGSGGALSSPREHDVRTDGEGGDVVRSVLRKTVAALWDGSCTADGDDAKVVADMFDAMETHVKNELGKNGPIEDVLEPSAERALLQVILQAFDDSPEGPNVREGFSSGQTHVLGANGEVGIVPPDEGLVPMDMATVSVDDGWWMFFLWVPASRTDEGGERSVLTLHKVSAPNGTVTPSVVELDPIDRRNIEGRYERLKIFRREGSDGSAVRLALLGVGAENKSPSRLSIWQWTGDGSVSGKNLTLVGHVLSAAGSDEGVFSVMAVNTMYFAFGFDQVDSPRVDVVGVNQVLKRLSGGNTVNYSNIGDRRRVAGPINRNRLLFSDLAFHDSHYLLASRRLNTRTFEVFASHSLVSNETLQLRALMPNCARKQKQIHRMVSTQLDGSSLIMSAAKEGTTTHKFLSLKGISEDGRSWRRCKYIPVELGKDAKTLALAPAHGRLWVLVSSNGVDGPFSLVSVDP